MDTNEIESELDDQGMLEDVLSSMELGFKLQLPNEKLEYFRTNKHAIKCTPGMSTNNGYQQHPDGTTKRTKGHRRGVFLACADFEDENKIIIGFSLCHKVDRFDYRTGVLIPGLGKWYALQKGEKYRDCEDIRICDCPSDKQLPKSIVKIPQSMALDLEKFILRCRKFYKDKILPPWTTQFTWKLEEDTEV